jgi:ribosomal protein S18 acetylase RimI-like enzyme
VFLINGLAVSPTAQGRGVGRALVERPRRRRGDAAAASCHCGVLGCNVPARRLYERCGFEIEGVLRGEFVLDGVEVDDVLMARLLT